MLVAAPGSVRSPRRRYPLPTASKYWAQPIANAVCINLERRRDRWEEAQEEFEPLAPAIPLTRVEAVDGKSEAAKRSPDVIREWNSSMTAKWDPRTKPGVDLKLSRGEIGCALSHVGLWRTIAAQSSTCVPTLISEDDACFEPGALEAIRGVLRVLPEGWDLLYLGYSRPFKASLEPVEGTEGLLARPEYLHHTHGYLCSPSGARKLLDALPVNQPVDCFMAAVFPCLEVYAATPPICVQRTGSQSEDSDIRPSCARAHARLNLSLGAGRLMELARRNCAVSNAE